MSRAAAPVYLDLGGLLVMVVAYIVGFVVLLAVFFMTRRPVRKWVAWGLLAYVFGPIAYVVVEGALDDARVARLLAEREAYHAAVEKEFGQFCSDRKRKIHSTAKVTSEDALVVVAPYDDGNKKWNVNAKAISARFGTCTRSGMRLVEEKRDYYDLARRTSELQVRRYHLCEADEGTVVPATTGRFELRIGEQRDNRRRSLSAHDSHWLQKLSVRIVDLQNGATLAEDSLYALNRETEVSGCPEPMSQIAELVADTFPGKPQDNLNCCP